MNYEVVILAFTVLALMCPSVYTIAWSKEEKSEHLPILYIGLGISALAIGGAVLKSEAMVWLGLLGALFFFTYVVFGYNGDLSNVFTMA